MKNLAVMFMTHNHPETVHDVLGQDLPFYKNNDIDVYVLDDSDNEETREIVDSFISQGYENLFWIKVQGVKNGDEKYFKAIKGEYLKDNYKYIFPLKDRALFSEKVINMISEEVKADYDLIMLAREMDRYEVRIPPLQDVYTDASLFFKLYGPLTTNWRSIIYRVDSILDKERLKGYEEKYKLGNYPFNQTVVTFSGLADISNPKIKVIHIWINENDIVEYTKHGASSEWRKQVFSLWIDKWVGAISSLPEIYNPYKLKVLKSQTDSSELFGSLDMLNYYAIEGILTKALFAGYRADWSLVSDIPKEYVDLILEGQIGECAQNMWDTLKNHIENKDYDEAYSVFRRNRWLKDWLEKDQYQKLNFIFLKYRLELTTRGKSDQFEGINTVEDIFLKKF